MGYDELKAELERTNEKLLESNNALTARDKETQEMKVELKRRLEKMLLLQKAVEESREPSDSKNTGYLEQTQQSIEIKHNTEKEKLISQQEEEREAFKDTVIIMDEEVKKMNE